MARRCGQRERDLDRHLMALRPPAAGRTNEFMGGWPCISERLSAARAWASRSGRAELVREVNAMIRDGVSNLNGLLLEHTKVLDTLITETLGQYGIVADLERLPAVSELSRAGSHRVAEFAELDVELRENP